MTVNKAPLTVTPTNAARTYGAANPVFTGTVTGIQNGDAIAATYETTATTASAVGTYPITAMLTDPENKLGNYTVTNMPGTLTVSRAELTVTPASVARWVYESNPSLTGSIVGLTAGDAITASYTTPAQQDSPPGDYPIYAALNDAANRLGNYSVTSGQGTLTIYTPPQPVFNEGDHFGSVTQDVYLPSFDQKGFAVRWTSSNADVLEPLTGEVHRPSFAQGDANVTLQVSVDQNNTTYTETYTLTVKKAPKNDSESVQSDKQLLTIGYRAGDSATSVTGDVYLPGLGVNGSKIVWSSSQPSVIDPLTGNVARPAFLAGDANVELEAVISKGTASSRKTFLLTVLRQELALKSIEFSEPAYSVNVNGSVPTVVTAVYTNLEAIDISGQAVYTSANPDVAMINDNGVVTGVSNGQTVITAVYGGKSSSAAIIVAQDIRLERLDFAQPLYEISIDGATHARVDAHYTDGSTVDVTAYAQFASQDENIAFVDGFGLISGVRQGETLVQAVYGGLTAQSVVRISSPLETGSLRFMPAEYGVTVNQSVATVLNMVYSDNRRVNVSEFAEYTSSVPSHAQHKGKGVFAGLSSGTTVVTATYGGQTAQATLSVTGERIFTGVPGANNSGSRKLELAWTDKEGKNDKITFTMEDLKNGLIQIEFRSDSVHMSIDSENLSQLLSVNPEVILKIRTASGSLSLPIAMLEGSRKSAGIRDGEKFTYTIVIQKSELPNNAGLNQGTTVWGSPVQFEVWVTNPNHESTQIHYFDRYVERTVSLIGAAEPPHTATGVWWDEQRGEFRFVPTRFENRNGVVTAVMLRRGASLYTVIDNPIRFADLSDHWSKDDVELLASKKIVQGRAPDQFVPDESMTRAESAALLTRALGLGDTASKAPFQDIQGEWFEEAVSTAYAAGLIQGDEGGLFRPNDKMTREELAVMVERAIAYTGVQVDQEGLSHSPQDKADVSEWAREAVTQALQRGILQGDEHGRIRPRDNVSRAEVTVMLARMLKLIGFIQ